MALEQTRDLIYIDEAAHQIYKDLSESQDLEAAPFRYMKEIFLYAVCMGYRLGERRPLAGKRTGVFRWAQFSSQVDVPLLKAIAIADQGDVSVVAGHNRVMQVIEEYANAGIHELRASLVGQYGQPLWNLVALLDSFAPPKGEPEPSLDGPP